jgi:hypothetical protein
MTNDNAKKYFPWIGPIPYEKAVEIALENEGG